MSKNNNLHEYVEPVFALEYTKEEKVKFVKKGFIFGGATVLLMKFFFIPLLAEFASVAHNINFLGISGTTILLVGIFLGVPILSGIILLPIFKVAIKSIQQKQYPPKELKVFQKTRIIKGKKAIAKAVIILLLYFVAIIPVTIFGYSSLNIMLNNRNSGK
jgi:hypothetical protein